MAWSWDAVKHYVGNIKIIGSKINRRTIQAPVRHKDELKGYSTTENHVSQDSALVRSSQFFWSTCKHYTESCEGPRSHQKEKDEGYSILDAGTKEQKKKRNNGQKITFKDRWIGTQWPFQTFRRKIIQYQRPDSDEYYWQNIRKEELRFTRRQKYQKIFKNIKKCKKYLKISKYQKCVMVWWAISAYGKLKLEIIPGILDSERYVATLEKDWPDFITTHSGKNLVSCKILPECTQSSTQCSGLAIRKSESFPAQRRVPIWIRLRSVVFVFSRGT